MINEYGTLPPLVIDTLDRYLKRRIPTGSFLRAVLANDLFEAVGRADEQNKLLIPIIVKYIYNEFPSSCHGSYARVDAWLAGEQSINPHFLP